MKKYLILLAIATPLMFISPAKAQLNFSESLQVEYVPRDYYRESNDNDPSSIFRPQPSPEELMNKQYERWLWKAGLVFVIGCLGALTKSK